jgi:exonuclease SbcC
MAGRKELDNQLQDLRQSVADARAENTALKEAMNALKERIARLDQVEGAVCPLCGQPLSPADRETLMESLQTEGTDMGDRYRANVELQSSSEARVREMQAQLAGFGKMDDELRAAARQHDRLEAESARIALGLETWQAGGAERLKVVSRMLTENDYAAEARAALAEIDTESMALGYDAAAHDAVRRAESETRPAEEGLRALETARASLAPLERQIAGIETQLAADLAALASAEEIYRAARAKYESEAGQLPNITLAEDEVLDLQSRANRLRMDVGMHRQQVAVIDQLRERRERLLAQRDTLGIQVARLKTLERAFSKDGVPALLIEQALPEIEEQANKILDRLSSGDMSVRFNTQREYKDKARDDRKETLDIVISDSSGPREYELFSGGEAFRVNFAIRLALSRVLAQRAGARLQTLVIDEGFGSQDANGVQRLIEAINQVRPEFEKILVITHLEELKEAFPARIEVDKGSSGSRVRIVT